MKPEFHEKDAADECCEIAESIIDEINTLGLTDRRRKDLPSDVRRKGTLKRKIMRQIKLAKQIASS